MTVIKDCEDVRRSFNKMMENTTDIQHLSQINMSSGKSVPEPPRYILITASVMYSIIFLAGILANLSVIIIVIKVKRIHSRMNFLFANLSVADLLVLVVCVPSAALELYSKDVWYLGQTMCKLVPFLEQLVSLASVLIILVITYDRYKGICFPFHFEDAQAKLKLPIVVSLIWLVAGISSLPIIFITVHKDSKFVDGTPIKVCRIPINSSWKVGYLLLIFSCFFIMTLIILLYFIFRMCRKLIWHTRFLEDRIETDVESTVAGRRRIVWMLVVVVLAFFICLLPQRIIGLWIIFVDRSVLYSLGLEGYLNIVIFPRVLVYLSSAANPVIYNIMSVKFKSALMSLLCSSCHDKHAMESRSRSRTNSVNVTSNLWRHDSHVISSKTHSSTRQSVILTEELQNVFPNVINDTTL